VPTPRATGPYDVLVVGGGIGGLANALALGRRGLRVRLLERASAFGEVGAGLQIAPNCTRILDSWGLLDEVLALGVQPRHLVMRDAVDGTELTRLDLADARARYGSPYVVVHRSDLHSALLAACRRTGVELVTDAEVTGYAHVPGGVAVRRGNVQEVAPVVLAADGLHSVARAMVCHDEPVSSAYVAYRGAVPADRVAGTDASPDDVVVHIGPHCHFVQYPLRRGELFNQVAVFRSAEALAGRADWGTPDELDAAFAGTCERVRAGVRLVGRDRWWRMHDREPVPSWVRGRLALTGDAAHPPLQYLAQGAVMAIEDAWVLAEHVGRLRDWDAALTAYDAVRPEHCRRVQTTARAWGELWHLDGPAREARNRLLRARDVHDYSFVDWLYGPTALHPADEPAMFTPVPLDAAPADPRRP
jgi:3-hydroxybenzoate 6-monooxygenase